MFNINKEGITRDFDHVGDTGVPEIHTKIKYLELKGQGDLPWTMTWFLWLRPLIRGQEGDKKESSAAKSAY